MVEAIKYTKSYIGTHFLSWIRLSKLTLSLVGSSPLIACIIIPLAWSVEKQTNYVCTYMPYIYIYIYIAASAIREIKHEAAAEMLIKHEALPRALLASRLHAECFISHIARARQYFNCFIEFSKETLRYKCVLWFIVA